MRSIGRRNIALVISETKLVLEQEKKSFLCEEDITTTVKNRLPDNMFFIWEGAEPQISRIIYDTINGR